jgi:kojibiose phosphorylase
MERKNNYYLALLDQMTPKDILPGSQELLAELRAAGIKTAVDSASKNARTVLENIHLVEAVDVLCDGYSVTAPKPAPDLFLFAAAQLGLAPEECVVVEDAEAGVEAALAAGMRCIGLGPEGRVGKAHLVWPSLEGLTLSLMRQRLGAVHG